MISSKDVRSPVNVIGEQTFFSLKHENIHLVAVATSPNTNTCMILEFLQRLIRLGESYFGTLNEDVIKANFIVVYELVDEICDFGFPQFTDASTLKLFINSPDHRVEKKSDVIKDLRIRRGIMKLRQRLRHRLQAEFRGGGRIWCTRETKRLLMLL